MRLNAFLARAGVASRRKADELIVAGRVTVNGEPGQLNTFVSADDVVEVDGRPVTKQRLAYVLLHKPAGVVTTAQDPGGRPTVVELVEHEARVVPVGRLDADTTGALLLTNDGALAHRLAHPRYEVDKVYEVEVEGTPADAALRRLAEGVELEDGRSAPAEVRRLGPSRIELTLHEGRKHQVKRMCEAVGHPVVRLHRSRYATLTLDGLDPGEWRELTADEVRGAARAQRLTKPITSYIRARVGADSAAAFSAPAAQQPPQPVVVVTQLAVALLDRRQQLDDRLGHVVLERPVPLAVVARLDLGDRGAGRHRHDLDQVGDARLRLRVVDDIPPGVGDGRLELLPDHVGRVDHAHDALRRSGRGGHQPLRLLEVLDAGALLGEDALRAP